MNVKKKALRCRKKIALCEWDMFECSSRVEKHLVCPNYENQDGTVDINMYTKLGLGLSLFCLQNCYNSLCHRFNKVLEAFVKDFGSF